jgi:phage tail P2-like protein
LLLDLLAWQFHCDFYSADFSIEQKQEIILKSLDWHTRKGTPSVIEEIVSTVFSKAIIQEWFEYGGLPYRFRIATDEQIPDTEELNKFLRAIKSVKNIRSSLDAITQLVYFLDEVITNELSRMTLQMKFTDDFSRSGKIFHNSRILRDGHTVRPTEKFYLFRNGTVKHDGSTYHTKINVRKVSDFIRVPIRHSSGLHERPDTAVQFDFTDVVSMTESFSQVEIWHHLFHNGRYNRNGTIKHNVVTFIPLE